MEKGPSTPKQPKLSRQSVLKLFGYTIAAVGGAVVANKFRPITEALQKLSFNPNVLLEKNPLTDSDINIIRHELTGLDSLLGFKDTKAWNKSVEQSCASLKDISTLLQSLEQSPPRPNSKEFILAAQDYHELSTTVWLLLKVNTDFKDRNENLRELVDSKQISEYIFTHYGQKLTTKWMHDSITRRHDSPNLDTLTDYLFATPEFLGDYASHFFDWLYSSKHRKDEIEQLGKTAGAKITEIDGNISKNDKARILHQLESLRLSKVARKLSFFERKWASGSHSHGYVKLGLTEQELKNLFSGKKEWQAFQLHEIGHIVWDLVKLIPDIQERSKLRAQLHGLLENFMPTKNLDAYLHPQGKFKSISNSKAFLNNVLNEASITQYPSGHFLFDLECEGQQLLNALLNQSEIGKITATDADITNNQYLSPLERQLAKKGQEILMQVDQSERVPISMTLLGTHPINNHRLLKIGIPLALQDMIQNNKDEVIELTLQSHPRYSRELINTLIKGYLLTTSDSLESVAGEELFSELFQSTLRRNNPEVKNEMQDNRLDQFQKLVDNILDALIKNKLARREGSRMVL